MKPKTIILSALLLLGLTLMVNAAEPVKRVSISGYDTMKFSVTSIEAKPGQQIIIEFKNEGSMPKDAMGHNWILLKAGVDPLAYVAAAANAKAENYQPKALANQVIASTPLLGPKEKAVTSFAAPTAPGTYDFICSFPAHTQAGMRGTLVVK